MLFGTLLAFSNGVGRKCAWQYLKLGCFEFKVLQLFRPNLACLVLI